MIRVGGGAHGIGRFSAAVLSRLPGEALRIAGTPSAPLDSVRLASALSHVPPSSIFFSPGYSSPLFSSVPFVMTIHDLNHIDRPENSSVLKRIYYSTVLKSACRRAAYVLTVSDYSKSRIVAWSGISENRVVNVGNGVDTAYNPEVRPYKPGYPYLLCMGNRKLHKNEFRVVDAFARASLPGNMRLIFSGICSNDLALHIEVRQLTQRIVFTGPIPEACLPSVYKGAEALIFPSLYEGFGLPVLEAMACGTPVITSNTTSLPEVVGDAALLVNPEDVDEITEAILLVVNEPGVREGLRKRGYKRSTDFKWEQTCEKVLDVIRRV